MPSSEVTHTGYKYLSALFSQMQPIGVSKKETPMLKITANYGYEHYARNITS